MPVYTVRVELTPEPAVSRGADTIIMTHHVWWDDDTTAIDEFPGVIPEINDAGISARWWASRGGPVHRVQLLRRDMSDRSVQVRLAEEAFSLAEHLVIGPTSLDPIPVSVTLTASPIFRHRRAAVLCVSYGIDIGFQKRTYVGPLSPVPYWVQFDTPIPTIGDGFYVYNPLEGDESPGPDDATDQWRVNIAESARDHVAEFMTIPGVTGFSVVPSWKLGDWSALGQVKCSYVIADLRDRGITMPMSPPAFP